MHPMRPRRKFVAMLVALVVAIASSALGPGVASAGADPAALKVRHAEAMGAVTSDGDGLERAKKLAALAELDDAAAARALAECVAAIAGRQVAVEAAHRRTLVEYEPFSGFTMTERKDWAKKEDLLERLEREDEALQGLGVVAVATTVAISRMKDASALAAVEQAASAESSPHARAILWGGLVANPNAGAPDAARKAQRDESPLVRLAVYDAIRARKDPALLEVAVLGLKEAGWPMRQAAVRALMLLGDVRAVPPLVAAMQTEEGALLEDFGKALSILTGERLGVFPEVWRKWYEEHKDDLAQRGAKGVTPPRAGGKPASPLHYYGVETLSRRVLFVIDVSGSMKDPIGTEPVEQTGVSQKDQPYSGPKIEVAKRVLLEAVRNLARETTFNIVSFSHRVQTFQDKMVPATPEMKAKAELAVTDLQPVGATWAYGALRRAFEFAGVSSSPAKGAFDPQVDTIFFLSDGAPTDDSIDDAKPMPPAEILTAVREWNRAARIRIHTIAIDPRLGKGAFVRFMKGLASENDGTYTEIGAK